MDSGFSISRRKKITQEWMEWVRKAGGPDHSWCKSIRQEWAREKTKLWPGIGIPLLQWKKNEPWVGRYKGACEAWPDLTQREACSHARYSSRIRTPANRSLTYTMPPPISLAALKMDQTTQIRAQSKQVSLPWHSKLSLALMRRQ